MSNVLERPIILREGEYNENDLEDLRRNVAVRREIDIYPLQLGEWFEIKHPTLIFDSNFKTLQKKFVEQQATKNLAGDWIFFPWNGRLVHTVAEEQFYELRTNRNKNLITAEEQAKLKQFTVGLVGLSVGNNIASALAQSGIADTMKLAEFDVLETTNLNRIRARIDQIGVYKIVLTAEQIYEINPYAEIICFPDGLTSQTLKSFISKEPRPRLLFEIIDSFEIKIRLRLFAKEFKVPVIMMTNLGDSVIIDVERYDLDSETALFNGRAGAIPQEILDHPDLIAQDKHRYAVALTGAEHIPKRAMDSMAEIEKTLVGRPQLTTTVTTASGMCAYLARQIVLGSDISGSWHIFFSNIFSATARM